MLIEISGISARTFYRRLQELRNQKLIDEKQKNYYMEIDTAIKIAETMGFGLLLERHINKMTK